MWNCIVTSNSCLCNRYARLTIVVTLTNVYFVAEIYSNCIHKKYTWYSPADNTNYIYKWHNWKFFTHSVQWHLVCLHGFTCAWFDIQYNHGITETDITCLKLLLHQTHSTLSQYSIKGSTTIFTKSVTCPHLPPKNVCWGSTELRLKNLYKPTIQCSLQLALKKMHSLSAISNLHVVYPASRIDFLLWASNSQ